MTSYTKFDASEFLDNEEIIAHYLDAALEVGNPDLFALALSDVAKARGISQKTPPASAVLRGNP
jgi:probable addiction module antidote protein